MPRAVMAEDKIFQALADPSRRAIFESLTRGEAAVKDLTARFDISQSAVSQHLATLKDAGLVNGRREGRCVYYRVEPRGMKPLIDWIRGPAAAADTGVRQPQPRRCRMARSDEAAAHIPPAGWHAVTPRIVVKDPAKLVAFVQAVFHAAGAFDPQRPTVLSIGDSRLMVSGADDRMCRGAFLYTYVPDVESVYKRALQHGAKPIEAPLTTPYGDRRCMVEDPWDNWWQIATYGASPGAA